MTRKLFIISCINIFVIINVYAQQWPYQTPSYPFINYDTNQIQLYGDEKYAKYLFETLNRIIMEGNEQLSVIQFGGSHIQAGYWSGQIRLRMSEMFPGLSGAIGYVFPFEIAKTNTPFHYKATHEGTWDYSKITDKKPYYAPGAGGIVAHATDTPAMISIVSTNNLNYQTQHFNKITIFHDTTANSYEAILIEDSLVLRKYTEKENGTTTFYLKTDFDTLSFKLIKTDSIQDHFNFYGAYLENDNPGITYSGIGINGAATSSYLKCEYFEEQLCSMHPDLVIFSIGVNDASGNHFNDRQYQMNYEIIIEKIRKINPGCMFIFTTNNDFYSYYGVNNPFAHNVYEVMQALAEKYGGAIWDMFTVMGGSRSINIWRSEMLAKRDRIHFTGKGYKLVGDLFFDAFLHAYANYLTTRYQYVGMD